MLNLLIKVLPNGRVLLRNGSTRESAILKATEVSSHIENLLSDAIEAQEAMDSNINDIKAQALQHNNSGSN